MKLKKLMSVVTAAIIVFSAASTVLSTGMAAYEYYLPASVTVGTFADKINAGDFDTQIQNGTPFKITYTDINSETIIGGPALRALKSRLAALGKSFVRFEITDSKSISGAPIKYTATLDSSFFEGISTAPPAGAIEADGNGVNLALGFVLDGVNKRVTVTGLSNTAGKGYYDKTITYNIDYSYAMTVLSNAGVSTSKKIRYYYKSGADEITVNIANASSDQSFYMNSATYGGLIAESYDPVADKYYSYEESDPQIKQALADAFGFASTDGLDDIALGIKSLIDGAYVNEDDINAYIKKYFFEDSVSGKDHREKLAELLLKENRDQVVDALYEVFGDGTTTRQETAILDYIWDELEDKVADEVEDRLLTIIRQPDKYDTSYLFYVAKELFDYNIKQWTEDNLRTLQILIDDLKVNYPNMTITQIIEKILKGEDVTTSDDVTDMIKAALEQALGYNSTQYTNMNIRERIAEAVTEINNTLKNYSTKAEMIAAIPAAVADYFAKNAEKFKGDTGKSAYQIAVENGFGGTEAQWLASLTGEPGKSAYEIAKEYGYTGTEAQWLASLFGAPGVDGLDGADGKDGKDGRDGRDGRDGVDGQSFSDWAIQHYGSVDGFIAAVVNEVLRNVKDGDSAYEIAVKNGFRGSEQDWLDSLVGESAYDIAIKNGYRGSEDEWLESLRGRDGADGEDGKDGRDGRDGQSQIIYLDSYSYNSAGNFDAGDPDESEEEISILDESTYQPNKNAAVAGQANTGNSRSANPSTGAAAGIIIPAAAVAAVLLVKKDKRKRGRK